MESSFSLKNRNIVVTGASSGIGRQCSISFSRYGANVIMVGRDSTRLEETCSMLDSGNHLFFSQDITIYEQLEKLISNAVSRVGKISGFVHSAGIELIMPLQRMKPYQYENLFSINVISAFELARIISKKKYLSLDGASFVFISSVVGVAGDRALVGYSSSKGALISGCRSMALELGYKNIRVNCILPGHVEGTPMSQQAIDRLPESALAEIAKNYPLGLGKPEDIAGPCVFLLSDTARWITGAAIPVDGGRLAG